MKIRVTIMTENDKHLPGVTKEKIEDSAKFGWDLILKSLAGDFENAHVESCELVEE